MISRTIIALCIFLCFSVSVVLGRSSCPAVEKCVAALEEGKPCPLLPVPEASLPYPNSEKGFNLTQLRPGVYRYDDELTSSLILFKENQLALVDFPDILSSYGPNGTYHLTTAVTEVLEGSIPRHLHLVYGHRHTDHIGGAGLLKSFVERLFPGIKVSVWGTPESKKFIQRSKNPSIPVPNVIVKRPGRTLKLAKSLKVRLLVVGGHVNSDIAAHVLPSEDGPGVLHYADILTPGSVPFLQFSLAIDLATYISAQEELLKLDYEYLNAGHGLLGTKRDLQINIDYTKFVIKAAAESAENVDQRKIDKLFVRRFDPNAPEFGNTHYLGNELYRLLSEGCVKDTIERWGCELSGADLNAPSHCLTAIFFNSIDNHENYSNLLE